MARLPTPPQRVVPPEGLPMPPTATEATASPVTMILNYLQSRGYQPSSENVRRALEANAKDPGLIPGLRSDTAATDAEDQAAMRAAGKGGGRSTQPQSRSTLPVDLTHGPTNEADWQPNTSKTTSAPPAAQDVLSMQNATNPAMRAAVPNIPVQPPSAGQPPSAEYVGNAQPPSGGSITINPDALPGPRNPALSAPPSQTQIAPPPTSLEQAMIEALTGPNRTGALPAPIPQAALPVPPQQITGPPQAPEAPMAPPNSSIQLPGPPAAPQAPMFENVPPPPPIATIQAPPASSIPPSGGLNIEDRMMPGRGNLTIQAPSAASMPATQPPVIEQTRPILDRIVRGAGTGAGMGRIAGPYGAAIGGVAGAVPGLWDLGKHIVGR